MTPDSLLNAAEDLRSLRTQIAHEFAQSLPATGGGTDSDRILPLEPFELAMHIVDLSADALCDKPVSPVAGDSPLDAPPAVMLGWLRGLEHLIAQRLLARPGITVDDMRIGLARLAKVFDQLGEREMQSYQTTYDAVAGWQSRVGADLLSCLASGAPVEPRTVNAQARILSIDPHQPFCAIAVCHEPAASPHRWAMVRRRILDILWRHDPQRETLIRDRNGVLLALTPAREKRAELLSRLDALLADEELARSVFVSSGEPAEALATAGRSCRQALSALEIAVSRGYHGQVTQCTEVILEVLLAHNNWVSHRIVDSRLGSLIEKPHLLETLRAYIDCNMALQRAAAELVVHPNTVAYRLRQIAALTGRDMRKVSDLSDLMVALTALDVINMREEQGANRADLRALLLT